MIYSNHHSKRISTHCNRFVVKGVLCAFIFFVLFPIPSAWANCVFTSLAGVNFGNYDVFSSLPNNNGVGSITVNCRGGTSSFEMSLSSGVSNSFTTRTLMSGSQVLNYNLYTNIARTVVWGDGTGGSVTLSGLSNGKTTINVFGQIYAGQNAKVGIYSDTIVVTVRF
jgi:spore coat protein U-like protein